MEEEFRRRYHSWKTSFKLLSEHLSRVSSFLDYSDCNVRMKLTLYLCDGGVIKLSLRVRRLAAVSSSDRQRVLRDTHNYLFLAQEKLSQIDVVKSFRRMLREDEFLALFMGGSSKYFFESAPSSLGNKNMKRLVRTYISRPIQPEELTRGRQG
jgi:hypothetical protein